MEKLLLSPLAHQTLHPYYKGLVESFRVTVFDFSFYSHNGISLNASTVRSKFQPSVGKNLAWWCIFEQDTKELPAIVLLFCTFWAGRGDQQSIRILKGKTWHLSACRLQDHNVPLATVEPPSFVLLLKPKAPTITKNSDLTFSFAAPHKVDNHIAVCISVWHPVTIPLNDAWELIME